MPATRSSRSRLTGRLVAPAVSILLGLLIGAGLWIGGQPIAGVVALGVNLAWAGGLALFGHRSETVGVFAGTPADERWAFISVEAAATAGAVAMLVALGGYVWEVAQRGNGYEFLSVATIGGLTYIVSVLWQRR
jgi:hypothetical protein